MTKRRVKNYTEEFQQSSAKLASESDQSISHMARELGINPTTLHGWVNKYVPKNSNLQESVNSELQSELKRLKKELVRVTQERDILKKVTAYFARETQ